MVIQAYRLAADGMEKIGETRQALLCWLLRDDIDNCEHRIEAVTGKNEGDDEYASISATPLRPRELEAWGGKALIDPAGYLDRAAAFGAMCMTFLASGAWATRPAKLFLLQLRRACTNLSWGPWQKWRA